MVIDTTTEPENELDRRERVWRFEREEMEEGIGPKKERLIREVEVSELGKLRNEWAECTSVAS